MGLLPTAALVLLAIGVAHNARARGEYMVAFLALAVGLYLIIPTWPGTAYDLLDNALHNSSAAATQLLGAITFLAVACWGCKWIFADFFNSKKRSR